MEMIIEKLHCETQEDFYFLTFKADLKAKHLSDKSSQESGV